MSTVIEKNFKYKAKNEKDTMETQTYMKQSAVR